MLLAVETPVEMCASLQPCLNGATCFDGVAGDYFCLCVEGFAGINCEEGKDDINKDFTQSEL